jgi:glycogen synthase
MLGWELPPYNSGGLGTASLGLTEGLAGLGTDIRFVVPKIFGKLPYDHMEVISAAEELSPAEIARFMKMTESQQELAAHTLAYGDIATHEGLSLKEMRERIVAGHVSAKLQANWYARQSEAIACRSKFDIVHTHDWMTYPAGIAARQVSRNRGENAPFVAHVHATEIDRCGRNGDRGIIDIERRGLAEADRVVAVSHYTKEVVHKEYDVPRSKISVVYNGVATHKEPQRFDIAELKKHHKIVLFMGRITYQKGPDYFVKLAKAVAERDPSVRFVMVGAGDMEKACIVEAAAQGLTGKMLFSSFLRGADVDRAYQLADLFVMPSVSEPFGIVALEAIQNGTPALVSKQSGVAEVSQHLEKVDFWDIEAMRDAVLRVLNQPGHAEHLKKGALADLQHLSWNHAAATMNDVYNHSLGGPSYA